MRNVFIDERIKIGDRVISNGLYPNLLNDYFYNGPLTVIAVIENAPVYAGGKFIICNYGNQEVGFYLNGVKKA